MNIIVEQNNKGERLDKLLQISFPEFTRSHIKKLIENGNVLVNGNIVKAGYALKVNDVLSVTLPDDKKIPVAAENISIDVIYQDKDLLVVNKPQGMVVHPGSGVSSGTLVNALLYSVHDLSGINGEIRPGIVHRLDKNTSGLMLVAKNDNAHVNLQKQIGDKVCKRKYLALLVGELKESEGKIETFYGRHPKERKQMAVLEKGKKAITNFKAVKYYKGFTLCEFSLETGRTHQIRVHSKYMNHPIVGDDVYGKAEKHLNGQLLHSYYIGFYQPTTKKWLEFTVPLPDYFQNYLNKLKEKNGD